MLFASVCDIKMHLELIQEKKSWIFVFQSNLRFFSEAVKGFKGIRYYFQAFLQLWIQKKITLKKKSKIANIEIPYVFIKNPCSGFMPDFKAFNASKHLNGAAYNWEDAVTIFCQHCSFLVISLSKLFYYYDYYHLLAFI